MLKRLQLIIDRAVLRLLGCALEEREAAKAEALDARISRVATERVGSLLLRAELAARKVSADAQRYELRKLGRGARR